jgi:drug/metabolite transporter (DMT)-like permease
VYFTLGRTLRASLSLLTYIFVTYSTAAVVLLGLAGVLGLPLTGYAWPAYLWFALLALIPQLIGHSAFNWALRYLPATYVSITILGEPIGSTLLAMWLLGERPSALKIAGGGLILIGILVASRPTTPSSGASVPEVQAEVES